jgi:hypothetical protein
LLYSITAVLSVGFAGCTDRIEVVREGSNSTTTDTTDSPSESPTNDSNVQSNEEPEVDSELVSIENISIAEKNLEVGDEVQIRVRIEDANKIEADYQLTSRVGDTTIDTQTVTVASNTTNNFNIQPEISEQNFREGEYDVYVNSISAGSLSLEDPVELITRLESAPDPIGGSVETEETPDGFIQYSVPIENRGESGEIDYALFWVEDENENKSGENTEYVETQSEFFESGETKTVNIVAGNSPPEYWGYNMKWAPGELVSNVRNEGGEGRFEAMLIIQTDAGQEIVIENVERTIAAYSTTSIQWNPELRQTDAEGVSDFIFTTEVNPI